MTVTAVTPVTAEEQERTLELAVLEAARRLANVIDTGSGSLHLAAGEVRDKIRDLDDYATPEGPIRR